MRKKKSIISIVGPTASGKSELAVKLAKKFNGEIISADSRQVYKGLDIGSGKVKGTWRKERMKKNMCNDFQPSQKSDTLYILQKHNQIHNKKLFIYKNIPHHCIDYISPKKCYTVVDFRHCARQAIEDIHARGKIPFLVGGTGFYIDAVLDNAMFPAVPSNPALRKKLERLSSEKLFTMLTQKDPRRAATIDPHNERRIIRALEIIADTKNPVPPLPTRYYKKLRPQEFIVLLLGIKKDRKTLRKAITKRVRAMLKQGLVAETKKLRKQGLSWKRIAEFGFEYRLSALFLQKKISRKELEDKLLKENWRYAKRQMTWFKHNKNIRWISSFSEVLTFLTKALK